QLRQAADLVRISNKAGGVDDDLALVEHREKDLAKGLRRAGLPPFRGQQADADGAVELAEQVYAEGEGVRQVVILIGDALLGRFLDRALAQIGPVAEVVDFLLFIAGLGQTVIDLFEKIRTPSIGRGAAFGRGSHSVTPEHFQGVVRSTNASEPKP